MSEHGAQPGLLPCQVQFTNKSPADQVVSCEIDVDGVIDIATATELRDILVNTIDNGTVHLTIDIDDVEFLDASGLGVLVGASKRIRAEGGSLKLICSNERLLQIFRITGLAKAFGLPSSIHSTIAVQASAL
ncbi:MAG: STAS domain-containing protein [Propionibacteriales bacterium]|nr:STAS domain-containing protein [Propionibacteriales bacterium]